MRKFSSITAALIAGVSLSLAQDVGASATSGSQDNEASINTKWLAKMQSKTKNDLNTTSQATKEARLGLISVIANRSQTDIAKYVGQVSVITSEEFDRQSRIVDALGQISGIQFGNDYGRQAGQQFRIRGFGYQSESRVIIEQDGIKRSPSLYSNQISIFRTDSDLLKRVEVVKGASSVLHGSGAIGGIISMQTKGVDDYIIDGKNYGVMLGHRQESNHMNAQRGAIAVKPTENFGILLYGKHAEYGNINLAGNGNGQVTKTQNDEQVNTTLGKFEWDITDEHRLEASLYNYHENLVTGWQSLWRPAPEPDAPVVGRIKQRDYQLIYKYAPINNPWINFSSQYYHSTASYHRVMKGTSGGRAVNNDYLNNDKRWGLNLKNESLFDTWGVEHRLVVGAEYEDRRENGAFTTIRGVSDMATHPADYEDYGLYLQDIFNIGKFELTLGGRYDRFERQVQREGQPKYTESRFSPKIAAAYEIFEGINLLAGYAETFRAPTPHESGGAGPINPYYWMLPNTSLKPETAKEYELGFSIERAIFGSDNLYLKATYYNGKIKDMISVAYRDDLGTPPNIGDGVTTRRYANYTNVSRAKRYGYEVEGRYDIANFTLNFGYDHMKIYNARTKARLLPYADKITLGAHYTFAPWALSGGLDMSHYMKPARDAKTTVSQGRLYYYTDDSFTIINFRGIWRPKFENNIFGKGVKIGFGVNNIFDAKYIHPENVSTTSSTGRGRNFYVDFEKIF